MCCLGEEGRREGGRKGKEKEERIKGKGMCDAGKEASLDEYNGYKRAEDGEAP